MQNTTADYKLEINKPSRSFECKITIGNNIYTNEDLVNLTLEFTQPQEGFSIGGTISKSLDLTLLNRGDTIYSTSQIKIEIGLKIGSKIEYILMGLFNIDDIEKTDYTTKFTAYDNMIKFETPYFSSLGDKPTLQQVVNELSSKTGVEFTGSLPVYTVSKLEGFSCREVLSYVASICGGNAFITRDGKFTIKTLSEVEKVIDGSNYFNYTREEVKYKVGQISCQVDENNILSKGSIGTDSMELGFENPWITGTILTEIYNKLNELSYLGYSMKWQGDLSLDPYDIITVTDVKNVVRKIPILNQKITYTGGLTSEIGAKGETKNKNSFSSSGSTTNKVNRLVTEQAIIKEALIEKANIKDLEAVSIRTQTLEAKTAKIEEAIIDVAHISDLNAINANIQNLIAADATINNALIGKADITELNAVKGTITSLDSKIANIETLVNGNLSSENIQAGGITSDKLTIANGFITNAMIASLDVAKINAGDISTNKFRIVSDSGKMLISDNTIQIRDNNRVRVQIGKDASNDYNMYVWDSVGKLMFDATGLKADGIKNKIIRDDMISDSANISGSKINISSLVTEINKDTNTTVIKSSKIQLDTVGQTLEVAFNSLKTQSDKTKSLTESNSTAIGVMQGQISTAINNTQIVKDGQTILLKDDYNRTVAKVDSINSTIGTHTTKINELTGSITSVDTKVNSVQRDLEGTKSTVSSHSTSITDLSSKVSTQGTSISQLQNQIKLKVESTEVNTIVNGAISKTAKSLDVMYYLSTSATSLAGGSWSTTAPTWTNGKYMWSKTVTTFVDGSKKESSPTCIAGATGATGANGAAGKGIKSIVEQYYLSTSNTTQTGGSWVTSPPAWANGKYMWTRSVITYTDNSTTSTNPVCVSGSKGDTGAKGDKGATGAKGDTGVGISSVDVEYYLSTSSTSLAGGSWSTTAPAWVNGKYMWSRTKTVTTTGATTYSNPVCITGAKGATGATGTKGDKGDTGNTGATGQGISSITEEYYLSTSKTSQTGGSWTTTPPTWSTGKYVWTRSKIVYKNPTSTAYTTPVCDSSWEAVNEVQVGGRNLLRNTSYEKDIDGTNNRGTHHSISRDTSSRYNGNNSLKVVCTKVSISGSQDVWQYTHDVLVVGNNAYLSFFVKGSISTTGWVRVAGAGTATGMVTFNISTSWTKVTINMGKVTGSGNIGRVEIIYGFNAVGTYYMNSFKLEYGNKATDWSPAPEDVDNAITSVDSKVITTSNKVATIETNLNSITQRVSSTESTVSTHTTQLGTVDSRINTAKNSAISTAASDATIKANNAQTNAVNSAKSYTDGQITTVNKTITNKVAEIKATTDSITSKVEIIESTTTTINGNVTSLQSKVNTVESKITGTAIVNTISSTITGGKGSISTTQFIMDKNGLTIKNGAIKIQNKSGTNVLVGDTAGNLTIIGDLTTMSGGKKALEAKGRMFNFYDWGDSTRTTPLASLYSGKTVHPEWQYTGLAIAHNDKSYITFSSNVDRYIDLDREGLFGNPYPITLHKNTHFKDDTIFNKKLYIGSKAYIAEMGFASTNYTGVTGMCIDESIAGLGFRMRSLGGQLRFEVSAGAEYPINFYGNTRLQSSVSVVGNLSVSGSKNSLQETKNYGKRLINAYETAEYYYSDLGFGKINAEGECYINIDDILQECVNLDCKYHVFTQAYNGKITKIERCKNYFIVYGESDTEFSWQYAAKRLGYENVRLDNLDLLDNIENSADPFDEDFIMETNEELLVGEITNDLENILMS